MVAQDKCQRPLLPARYSPLQANGHGLQGVYLAEVPELMAQALIGIIGAQAYFHALASLTGFPSTPDVEDDAPVDVAGDLAPTFKDQVIKARRGQGVFRANVMLVEEGCRVTHVTGRSQILQYAEPGRSQKLRGPHADLAQVRQIGSHASRIGPCTVGAVKWAGR